MYRDREPNTFFFLRLVCKVSNATLFPVIPPLTAARGITVLLVSFYLWYLLLRAASLQLWRARTMAILECKCAKYAKKLVSSVVFAAAYNEWPP